MKKNDQSICGLEVKAGLLSLIKFPSLRRNLLCMGLTWFWWVLSSFLSVLDPDPWRLGSGSALVGEKLLYVSILNLSCFMCLKYFFKCFIMYNSLSFSWRLHSMQMSILEQYILNRNICLPILHFVMGSGP